MVRGPALLCCSPALLLLSISLQSSNVWNTSITYSFHFDQPLFIYFSLFLPIPPFSLLPILLLLPQWLRLRQHLEEEAKLNSQIAPNCYPHLRLEKSSFFVKQNFKRKFKNFFLYIKFIHQPQTYCIFSKKKNMEPEKLKIQLAKQWANETKTPHTYSQNNSKAPKFLKDMVISWFFT